MNLDEKIFLTLFEKYLKQNYPNTKAAKFAKSEYDYFQKEHKKLLEKYDDSNT